MYSLSTMWTDASLKRWMWWVATLLLTVCFYQPAWAANPPPVQIFYVPFPEDQVFDALEDIYPGAASCPVDSPDVTDQINSYVSIAAVADNTVIYYDHWEDGFEIDLANPTQATTEIWGDGDPTNGQAPGSGSDIINADAVIVLDNVVDATNVAAFDFDGRDKIGASKTVALTRAAWSDGPETLLAGALEVYDTNNWGTRYLAPVGQDVLTNDLFEYTGLTIMARQNNTQVQIDAEGDGTFENTITLNQGESHLVAGGVNAGGVIESSAPIQAALITGDICANYESRWFILLPEDQWTDSYYNAVGTPAGDSTFVFLYNPDTANPIDISWETNGGTQPTLTVAPGGVISSTMPDNSGARFFTDSSPFFAIATIDSDGERNLSADWGYTLIPDDVLTPQVLIGWGPGQDPTFTGTRVENGSPVWVTPVWPKGATGSVTVCVDYNGDGVGARTDTFGSLYDDEIVLDQFEIGLFRDPDGDQTGLLAYVCDGSDVKLAAAWGQEPTQVVDSNQVLGPNEASPGSPGLDLGTTIPPVASFEAGKSAQLAVDVDGDGQVDLGDTLLYSIIIRNSSRVPVTDLSVQDILSTDTTYISGTTTIDTGTGPTAIADVGTTNFPLDEGGYAIDMALPVDNDVTSGVFTLTFEAQVNTTVAFDVTSITNQATVSTPEQSVNPEVTTALGFNPVLLVTKEPDQVIPYEGTATFTITVENAGDIVLATTLSDPLVPDCDFGPIDLLPGAVESYSCSGSGFTADFTNIVTATGVPLVGEPLTASDPADVQVLGPVEPGIAVTKEAGVEPIISGGVATFTIAVENTGNITLTDIVVSDPLVAACEQTIAELGPGEISIYTCQQSDVSVGFTNVVTATATNFDVSDSDDAPVAMVNPAISIVKLPDLQDVPTGDSAEFTIVVSNTGDVDLTSVVVSDPLTPSCDSQSYTCTVTPDASFTNIASVTGMPPAGAPITETDSADVVVFEPANPQIALLKESAPGPILVGGTANFTLTVQNTGNVTLTDVILSDPLAAGCDTTIPVLAPLDSVVYTCEQDNVSVSFTNVATATATNFPVSDSNDAPVTVVSPGVSIQKLPDLQQITPGQTADFTIVISNTGDVDLTNVVVSDALAPNCVNTIGRLAVGTSESYECSVAVTDDFTNTASVVATAPIGPELADEDDAVVQVVEPSLSVIKSPSVQVLLPGETALFEIEVINDGEIDINNLTLADELCDTLAISLNGNGDDDLTIGESWVYICEINNVSGKIFNVATASGILATGDTIEESSNEAEVNIFQANPSIDVNKKTETPVIYAGSIVTFAIKVSNDGDVPISGVNVIDPLCPIDPVRIDAGDEDELNQLASGEVWVYECAVKDVQDKFVNEVTVTGLPLNGALPQVSATDDERVDVIAPALSIEKGPAEQTVIVGSDATFTITVQNTGNVMLTDVVVSDPQCDVLLPADTGPFDLAVDEVRIFSCTIVDVKNAFTNNASANGIDPLGGAVTDSASADVNVIMPSIDVQKTPEKQVVLSGTDVEFEITVTNNGDVTLTNVSVSDPICGAILPVFVAPLTLAPGESQTFTCTMNEVDTNFTNVATASGTAPNGTIVSDEDDARVVIYVLKLRPSIELNKTPDIQEVVLGQDVTFFIDVTNDGNVAIKDLIVVDEMCDPLLLVSNGNGDIFLEVEETWTYQCIVPNVQEDFTNTAIAQGFTLKDSNKLAPATASDSADVRVVEPVINVSKTPDKQTIPVGGIAEFEITVTNKGGVALENVEVNDPKCKALVKPTDTILEPGEVWTYTCVKPRVESSFTNIAWATACVVGKDDFCIQSEPDEADVNVIEDTPPTILVTKKAGVDDNALINVIGGSVTFFLNIANTSETYDPVTIIEMVDDIYGDLLDPANPNVFDNTCSAATIEPGSAYACEFTANVSPDALDDIVIVTVVDDEGEIAEGQDDATVGLNGDVNCDKGVTAVDALLVLRFDVGLVTQAAEDSCDAAGRSINLSHCKIGGEQVECGPVYALFILQCDVGIANPLCPNGLPGTRSDPFNISR